MFYRKHLKTDCVVKQGDVFSPTICSTIIEAVITNILKSLKEDNDKLSNLHLFLCC